jgi:hypothetical protein
VRLNNVGGTPALNIQSGWGFVFIANRKEGPHAAPVPATCPPVGKGRGFAKPNDPWEEVAYWNGPSAEGLTIDQQGKMISEGRGTIFIFGCVKYEDVLGGKERFTEIGVSYPGIDGGDGFIINAAYSNVK